MAKKRLLRNKFLVIWLNRKKKEIIVQTVNRKKALQIEANFVDDLVDHIRHESIPRLFYTNKSALKFINSI